MLHTIYVCSIDINNKLHKLLFLRNILRINIRLVLTASLSFTHVVRKVVTSYHDGLLQFQENHGCSAF
jgi:hypothetical protein